MRLTKFLNLRVTDFLFVCLAHDLIQQFILVEVAERSGTVYEGDPMKSGSVNVKVSSGAYCGVTEDDSRPSWGICLLNGGESGAFSVNVQLSTQHAEKDSPDLSTGDSRNAETVLLIALDTSGLLVSGAMQGGDSGAYRQQLEDVESQDAGFLLKSPLSEWAQVNGYS